jgi:arabinose-5-phosphate isomerase
MSFKEFCRVMELEARAINDALTRFRSHSGAESSIALALQIIGDRSRRGGKVMVVGLGKSGKIAAKISATLSSTGTPSVYLHPTEALHGDLGVTGADDVVLAISQTGNTEEIVSLIPFFKKRGLGVVAITGNPESRLAAHADVVIDSSVSEEACAHNLAPTSSTTLALVIGDALAIALMRTNGFSAEDFARNHPGGSLGRRLQLTVADLMHPLARVAVLTPDSSMDEVLDASTRMRLGAALITEKERLVGIITDGDIRRALKQKEAFFGLCARDIMCADPTTVGPQTLAYDALRIMEERENQISVLPVVDSQGNALGLLRIHDLVQTF